MNTKAKKATRLADIFESLNSQRQQSLLDFAEYLYSLGDHLIKEIPEPEKISRPESETVVGAIKRLKASYHMIESMAVFSDASALMTEHMVKGRDAREVIDEMEALFAQAYQAMVEQAAGHDIETSAESSKENT